MQLLAEIRIHKSLSHPHVVKFVHFFEDTYNVYIILEVCHNRVRACVLTRPRARARCGTRSPPRAQSLMELLRRRKRLTDAEVQYFSLQIMDAMQYMRDQQVIHRDLKASAARQARLAPAHSTH